MSTSPQPLSSPAPWADAPSTGRLVLGDGTVIAGTGLGAVGSAVGEVCFNMSDDDFDGRVDCADSDCWGDAMCQCAVADTVDCTNNTLVYGEAPGGLFLLDQELGQRVFAPPPAEGETA